MYQSGQARKGGRKADNTKVLKKNKFKNCIIGGQLGDRKRDQRILLRVLRKFKKLLSIARSIVSCLYVRPAREKEKKKA